MRNKSKRVGRILKLGHEALIYDDFGFGANFKRRTKSLV